MDLLVFNRREYDRLYNCTGFDRGLVPLVDRQHVILGSLFVVLSLFYEVVFQEVSVNKNVFRCFTFFIAKRLDKACYKYMLYIGINDVLTLPINGFLTGYYGMRGTVFCDNPVLIYVAGLTANAFWYMETTVAIVLALSRAIETVSPLLGRRLFHGRRAWLWTIAPTIYGSYFGYFGKPIIFSSIYLSWFFNPFEGYTDANQAEYDNLQHTVHNVCVAVGLFAIYAVFIVLFKMTTRNAVTCLPIRSSMQTRAFTQVLVISFVNAVTALVYVFMQYYNLGKTVLIVGQVFWMSAHGLPAVTYVTMSKTMRSEFRDSIRSVFVRMHIPTSQL